ncbi:MAG: hypothetical protein AAGH15_27990 [Myxococcota bacterium]
MDDARPDLDAPWCLGSAAYAELRSELEALGPKTLVEFGSGASTIALSQDFPGLTILSIEAEPTYLEKTRSGCSDAAQVTVEHRELAWQRHGGAPFLSYRVGGFPESVDAVTVDGPPHWTRGGREACLYQVAGRLRVGGLVFLDDYRRRGEQRAVQHWLSAFEGAYRLKRVIRENDHVAVLEKVADHGEPRHGGLTALELRANALAQPVLARVRSLALGLRGAP